MGTTIAFVLFWGIWLLVPIAIDGMVAINQWIGVLYAHQVKKRKRSTSGALRSYPMVSLVIPVYNGASSIGKTIQSIKNQTYPQRQIEIIVVNNGSTDGTLEVVRDEMLKGTQSRVQVVDIPGKGKSWALNAGVYSATGEFVANVDSDTTLHPDAILQMVRAFNDDPKLGAATGGVQIEDQGSARSAWMHLVQECEACEYIASFVIGRQRQAMSNNLYTLAGAFSFFRRSVLLAVPQYSNRTVSEDTDITFWIHRQLPRVKIGCIPEAIIYVEPIGSLENLYSQRVRWQRGEMEVMASHRRIMWQNALLPRGFSPIRTLVVDHSFAFPRAAWTFLLPVLLLLGYPLPLVMTATILMYVLYAAVDGITQLMSYTLADSAAKHRLARNWWVFTIMPAYRFMLFWFRFGGFISAMTDPTQWKTASPWTITRQQAKFSFHKLYDDSRSLVRRLGRLVGI